VGGLDASKSSVKDCDWQLLLALCTAAGDWPSCTTIRAATHLRLVEQTLDRHQVATGLLQSTEDISMCSHASSGYNLEPGLVYWHSNHTPVVSRQIAVGNKHVRNVLEQLRPTLPSATVL
jgi:hypothetical protein